MLSITNIVNGKPAKIECRQTGVSMIEVLLAVFILAVGFLATAKMQALGVRNAQAAYIRSQASFLTKDMADRMRANIKGVQAGYYNQFDTNDSFYTQSSCVTASSSTECTPTQIAQNDLAEWTSYINPQNPETMQPLLISGDSVTARGTVTLDNNRYLITLVWSETSEGDELSQTMVTEFQP